MENSTILISSGAPWEATVGYSRAIRRGNMIWVSGTAPVKNGKTVAPGDAYTQTKVCLEIIKTAIEAAGGTMADVVRTRMYVTDISQWEAIGKAHGEYFAQVRPATTMVEVRALIEPDMLVEIEAEAILTSGQ